MKLLLNLPLWVMLLITTPVYASPYTLKQALQNFQRDSTNFQYVSRLAKEYYKFSVDSGSKYAHKALKYARSETQVGQALLAIAFGHSRNENFDSARYYYQRCHPLLNRQNVKEELATWHIRQAEYQLQINRTEEANANINHAINYAKQGNTKSFKEALCNAYIISSHYYDLISAYPQSIEVGFHALRLAEEIQDSAFIGLSYYKIGATYNSMEQWRDAIQYYSKAIPFLQMHSPFHLTMGYHAMSEPYMHVKRTDSSRFYLELANINLLKNPNKITRAHLLLKQGHRYNVIEEYANALPALYEGAGLAKEMESQLLLANIYYWIGDVHLSLKNFDSSEYYFANSLTLAQQLHHLQFMADANNALSILFEKKGDYKKSLAFAIAFTDMMDTIYSSRKWNAIKASEIKYESELKEKIIAAQQNTILSGKQKNKLLLILIIIAGIVLAGLTYLLRKIKNQKEKLALLNQEIETQKTEILHISVNNFKELIGILDDQGSTEKEKQLATENQERISMFAILLRLLLGSSNRNYYPLLDYAHEIANAKKGAKNFQFPIHIQSSHPSQKLNYKELSNIGLILNELITNSFKYAFAKTDKPEITIRFEHEPHVLRMHYFDNGIGLPRNFQHAHHLHSFGLTHILKIIDNYDGECTTESNNGAHFFILLRLKKSIP